MMKPPYYADDKLKALVLSFNADVAASYDREAEADKERAEAAQALASGKGDTTAMLKAVEAAEAKKRCVIVERHRLLEVLPEIVAHWNACRAADSDRHIRLANERRQHLLEICQRENLQPVEMVLNCCPVLRQYAAAGMGAEIPNFNDLQSWADGVAAAASQAAGVRLPAPALERRGRPGKAATP
jgi:hypothetical protein